MDKKVLFFSFSRFIFGFYNLRPRKPSPIPKPSLFSQFILSKMAVPQKVSDITLAATTLSDSDLPITTLNRAALASWLNGFSSGEIAVFFQEDSSTNRVSLVLAELPTDGDPSGTVQFVGPSLPCPRYCPQ